MKHYLDWTDEEREQHIIDFDDDVDKYVYEYKVTGVLPNLYITHIIDNEVVTEKMNDLIRIKLSKERLDKLIKIKSVQ